MAGEAETRHPESAATAPDLSRIALALLARLDSDKEAGEALLVPLATSLGWEAARLWEVEGPLGELRCTAAWSSAGGVESAHRPGEVSLLAEKVAHAGQPEWSLDGSGSGEGWQTALAFPLLGSGPPQAVVELLHRALRPPESETLLIVERLSSPLASWLSSRKRHEERHVLVARLGTAERRQRFLAEVSAALAGTLDERHMLAQLSRLAAARISDVCSAYLVGDEGAVSLVASEASDAAEGTGALGERLPGLGDEEGIGRVLRTGMPILYPRVSDALLKAVARDRRQLDALRGAAPQSAMVVPIPGRGRTLGALALASLDPARIYTPDDLALAEEVGRRAGLAIAAAQLYRRERATADTLQAGLLPPALPRIPEVTLAGRYRAGEEGLMVGGDFYDGFQVEAQTWVLGIGDVCGHGPAAAALSAQVRHTARALASSCPGPAELLWKVNRLLRDDPVDMPFCTAAYAWLQNGGDETRLVLARAGHPPPLLHAGGTTVELMPKGPVLGLFDDVEFEEVDVSLGKGDLLLLYTDGVSEARSQRGLLGVQALADHLALHGEVPTDELADSIQRLAVDFSEGRLRDDIALLLIRAGAG